MEAQRQAAAGLRAKLLPGKALIQPQLKVRRLRLPGPGQRRSPICFWWMIRRQELAPG
jgi:hypothetical protein